MQLKLRMNTQKGYNANGTSMVSIFCTAVFLFLFQCVLSSKSAFAKVNTVYNSSPASCAEILTPKQVADTLSETNEDLTNTTFATRAWQEARQLKQNLQHLNIEQRLDFSVDYFGSQVKKSATSARGIESRFLDGTLPIFDSDSLKSSYLLNPDTDFIKIMAQLKKAVLNARQTATELILQKKLTMDRVAEYSITLEAAQAVADIVHKFEIGDNAAKKTHLFNLELIVAQYQRSILQIPKLIHEGYILFPTHASTSDEFFIGTWPRVRPVGLSTSMITLFDGINEYRLRYSAHDLTAHMVLNAPTSLTFETMEAIEFQFFNHLTVNHPELLPIARKYYFNATHESEYIPRMNEKYIQSPHLIENKELFLQDLFNNFGIKLNKVVDGGYPLVTGFFYSRGIQNITKDNIEALLNTHLRSAFEAAVRGVFNNVY